VALFSERNQRLQTTTTQPSQADSTPAPTFASRLNNPLVTGGVALIGWLVFVLIRLEMWGKGQIAYFIGVGHWFETDRAKLPPGIPQVIKGGYDGQFYYRLALDPFNWSKTAFGITMDEPYRYTRIGYPLVTWVLSLGHHSWVPVMLVVVNLASVAAMGILGGILAKAAGQNALWGLLFVAYFGLVISVGRDTMEPLSDACMLAGLVLFRRERYLWSSLLIAYSVVVNELALGLPIAIGLLRVWQWWKARSIKPAQQDLAWVVPGVAYVILELAQKAFGGLKGNAASSDVSRNLTFPLQGVIDGLYTDFRHISFTHMGLYDYNLLEFVTLAAFVVTALVMLRRATLPAHEKLAFILFVLVEFIMAADGIWGSVFGELRTQIEAWIFSVLVLLATPPKYLPRRRLAALAVLAAVTLVVVARRRVLFQ
jgi:hypothetical protein